MMRLRLDVPVLALLLRDHVRKEDGVIHPLLERLLRQGSRD